MNKRAVLVVMILAAAVGVSAADEPVAFDAHRARIFKGPGGQALTAPSAAPAVSAVREFLAGEGLGPATVRSLKELSQGRSSRTGNTHVALGQEVAGLRVAEAYVKATLSDRGEILHLIDNSVPTPARGVKPARIDERQALRAALAHLHPSLKADPASVGREGNVTTFAKADVFHAAPTVERVAVAMKSGAFQAAFMVQTWTSRGNLLHETTVSGDGRVLSVESRTNTDSYNVFPEHPDATAQTVVSGPGAGNAESPLGWVSGAQRTISIAGNNTHAYLDRDNNGAADAGGTAVVDGNFTASADLLQTPTQAENQAVAVQNLFYLNNVIHDTLYKHGFNEAAGNFQENNFGNGGRASDSVNAEGQDGGGVDNANFATPRDGQNPRMQMYLWTGKGSHQVVVTTPFSATYLAQGAEFGPALTATGVSGAIVLASDGTGATSDGCEAFTNGAQVAGNIALVDRGTCAFTIKVKNAQNAGAVGAIVANNAGDSIITMGGADATITISAVFIGKTDGDALKAAASPGGAIRLTDPAPLQRDGDVDSDIVWHEYGHGLTWRMIGRMDGPLSGAVGEGMSDVLAVVINDDDVVGEYSFDDPIGIRSARYTNYPRTYGDVTGSGVHFDGEVYGAIGWRLWENFQAAGLTKDLLLDYVVGGMNFTPAHPAYEHMRDGILQAAAGSGHECLVWRAFAKYGVGVGAKGVARGSKVTVTPSFTVPAGCPAP